MGKKRWWICRNLCKSKSYAK